MQNTVSSGFYKNTKGNVCHAKHSVDAPTFTLIATQHQSYTYPVDGWHWFNSEEEAYTSFGIPIPEQPSPSEP